MIERLKHRLPMPVLIALLAVIVGVLSGVGAFLLKRTIGWISSRLTSFAHPDGFNVLFVILPVVGIVLTGIVVRYLFKTDVAHGVRILKEDLSRRFYRLRRVLLVAPFLSSSITLGFGGSAGSEGPIAYTGAAIGSNVARLFGMSPRYMMILVGCGAGAGIAGIFKAPLGGVLFTLEVLGMELSTVSVLTLLLTCMCAGFTAYALSGFTVDMSFRIAAFQMDWKATMLLVLLGVVAGCYSLYYTFVMKSVEHILDRVKNVWVKNLSAGLFIGLVLAMFPALYGEGYGVIGSVLDGDLRSVVSDGIFAGSGGDVGVMAAVLVGIILLKCFVTSATNSGGGVAGDFAPTLFAGCMLGLLFAIVSNRLGAGIDTRCYAYLGMAAVMAGAIRAPFMAVFLTMEMTGQGQFMLPLAIVATVSFGVVRLFTFDDYYSRHADRPNGILSLQKNAKKKSDA